MTSDPYAYTWLGKVVRNDDPQGIYRVTVMVPGLEEPESNWALPRGTIGGGSYRRGGWLTPAVGANVYVSWLGGDRTKPLYEGGPWAPGDQPQDSAKQNGTLGDPDVLAIELGGVRLKLGANGDKGYFRVMLAPGDDDHRTLFELDGTKSVATLSAITRLIVTATGMISVDAAQVEFFKDVFRRLVRKMAKPI